MLASCQGAQTGSQVFFVFSLGLLSHVHQHFHSGSVTLGSKTTCCLLPIADSLFAVLTVLSGDRQHQSSLPPALPAGDSCPVYEITCSIAQSTLLYLLCMTSFCNDFSPILLFFTCFILCRLVVIAGGVKSPPCNAFHCPTER